MPSAPLRRSARRSTRGPPRPAGARLSPSPRRPPPVPACRSTRARPARTGTSGSRPVGVTRHRTSSSTRQGDRWPPPRGMLADGKGGGTGRPAVPLPERPDPLRSPARILASMTLRAGYRDRRRPLRRPGRHRWSPPCGLVGDDGGPPRAGPDRLDRRSAPHPIHATEGTGEPPVWRVRIQLRRARRVSLMKAVTSDRTSSLLISLKISCRASG